MNGECLCSPGWGGINCELPRAQCPDQCSGHGTYLSDTGLCSCDPNWMGPDCSVGKKTISCNFASVLLFWKNVNIGGGLEMQIGTVLRNRLGPVLDCVGKKHAYIVDYFL